MSGLLQITTFGGLSIQLDGQPVTGFASRKVEALLVYLACTGRAQRREVLAELLWEERSQARAMSNLRVALASLRKELDDFVSISRDTAAINPDSDVWLDTAELEAGLTAGQAERVVTLYRGAFLEGYYLRMARGFDGWVTSERQRWHQTVIYALHQLLDSLSEAGRYEAGLAHARDLLQLDPLDEAAHRKMMALLAYSDQRAAALAQYESCCQILADELGVEPTEETRRLFEQIQAGELEAPPVMAGPEIEVFARPPTFLSVEKEHPAPLFVAREHQLGRLDDLLDKALDGDGSLAFVTGGPGRGKTALLEAFSRRALETHPDLLVASGACNQYAGVGDPYLPWREVTSMLAGDVEAHWSAGSITTEHARRLWTALPKLVEALLAHGPHLLESFVPGKPLLGRAALALPEPSDALGALRVALERQGGSAPGLEQSHIFEQFSNLLRAVADEHPLLLILDDLQWADASSISLLFHLGRRLAGARLLVVGAYRPEEVALGRDGERHPLEKVLAELKRQYGDIWIDLANVEELEGRHFVDALLDSESNQLGDDFREALYRRTGGQPLFTVELLRAMQARGDLLQDERGGWVTGPSLDWERLPARVEAVIEERIARLDAELRQILTVASVEGEDFTAQVVARLQEVGERDLLRTLSAELEKRHRLVREGGDLTVGQQILSRYRFAHVLFQSYLYNGLSQGERRLLHRQVAQALEALYGGRTEEIAEQLAFHYVGDLERERYYTRLAGERAAARYANAEALHYFGRALELTPEDDLPGRFDLLLAREAVFNLQGKRQEQRRILQALKRLAEAMDDDRRRLQVAIRQARCSLWGDDYPAAVKYAQEGIRLAEAIRDVVEQAEAYLYLGVARYIQGDHKAMNAHLERALQLARAGGSRKLEADVLRFVDREPHLLEDRHRREQALQIYRQIGDQQGEARALHNLGYDIIKLGDFLSAMAYYEESLAICRRIGDISFAGAVICDLADAYLCMGDFSRAQVYAEQGYRIGCELGEQLTICSACSNLGHIHALQGDYTQARDCQEQALIVAREIGAKKGEYGSLCLLSLLYHLMGDYPTALTHAQKALQLAQEVGEITMKVDVWPILGFAREGLGDLERAAEAYQQALGICSTINLPHWMPESQAGLARLSLAQGNLPQAQAHVEQILSYLDSKTPAAVEQGAINPFVYAREPSRIYLTCYRVLKVAGEPRAGELLRRGYARLQASAATIEDEERRRSFLEKVPANRELLRAWEEREGA